MTTHVHLSQSGLNGPSAPEHVGEVPGQKGENAFIRKEMDMITTVLNN